jgi:hypothetical protein
MQTLINVLIRGLRKFHTNNPNARDPMGACSFPPPWSLTPSAK